MSKAVVKNGFTLVELSLSIAFIAVLSIIIVVIINNTISSYRRGLTLNKINSVGMDLADDIRAAIQNSSSRAVTSLCSIHYPESSVVGSDYMNCVENGARNFVSVARLATVRRKVDNVVIGDDIPVYGAFCTGYYSYIWNSGYFSDDYIVDGTESASLRYRGADNAVKTASNFKLLKLEDDSRSVCVSAVLGSDPNASTKYYTVQTHGSASGRKINNDGLSEFNISNYTTTLEEPIDILANDTENDLALYDFWSAAPAESKSQYGLFYVTTFTLGTKSGGINIKANGNFCATPADYQMENLDYCAINKFNIASQAMGV